MPFQRKLCRTFVVINLLEVKIKFRSTSAWNFTYTVSQFGWTICFGHNLAYFYRIVIIHSVFDSQDFNNFFFWHKLRHEIFLKQLQKITNGKGMKLCICGQSVVEISLFQLAGSGCWVMEYSQEQKAWPVVSYGTPGSPTRREYCKKFGLNATLPSKVVVHRCAFWKCFWKCRFLKICLWKSAFWKFVQKKFSFENLFLRKFFFENFEP